MKRKEVIKHIIDCSLAFAIAFISALLAVDEITLKIFIVAFLSALLIGIVKFREYYSTLLVPTPNKQMSTMFF